MTKITVKNEHGREHNPFSKNQNISIEELEFEKTVKTYPAPSIPDTKEGEFVEAELVWQYNDKEVGWIDLKKKPNNTYLAKNVRQIYRLVPQPKEQEKTYDNRRHLHMRHPKLTGKVDYAKEVQSSMSDEEIRIVNMLADKEPSCYADIAVIMIEYTASKDARIAELEARVKELEGQMMEAKRALKYL